MVTVICLIKYKGNCNCKAVYAVCFTTADQLLQELLRIHTTDNLYSNEMFLFGANVN